MGTPATRDTGYLGGRHWLSQHWLPDTSYPDSGYPTLATSNLLPLENEKDHTPTITANITTATASSNQRDSLAETSGQEQIESGAEKQPEDF
ncbi:hypothetical protein DAPPUDRAFT_328851 [Daphnia pulex]|uniref:Uncharacterized protein n=1 Tax=Daphnia pulex TaxID=6669 RepID=E9HEX9_DAPPU|nr:hypothetical protein DAPPUDRAFT_328851 [Daphnia pulex]|eukprot:EFX69675.1 hypothetical protein DAPPUDRAFT_328851 [Daphnia pulex]